MEDFTWDEVIIAKVMLDRVEAGTLAPEPEEGRPGFSLRELEITVATHHARVMGQLADATFWYVQESLALDLLRTIDLRRRICQVCDTILRRESRFEQSMTE